MAQILDPLPSNTSGKILCCYVNATSQIQVARIANIPNWYFERVVFPGQRLVFESVSEALLEIHTGTMASAILSDKIPSDRLQISEATRKAVEASRQEVASNPVKTNTREKLLSVPVPALTSID
jgi:hypothetical protein